MHARVGSQVGYSPHGRRLELRLRNRSHQMHPIILTAGLLLSLAPALAAADSAVLLDSGSTNTAGFRIEVNRSGEAVYTPPPRRGRQPSEEQPKPRNRRIPSPLIKRFFADLDAQRPFSALPNRGCMKSVSFGTTLTVEYQGERTRICAAETTAMPG